MLIIPIQTQVVFLRYPWVNFLWIGLCVAVFGMFNLAGFGMELLPWLVLDGWNPIGLVGYSFVHADYMHLFGNMLFLWVFGNAVNERFGTVRYLLFAIGASVISAATHNLFDGGAAIGASGAVNAIVGAYLVLYPVNRVDCFWWVFIRVGTFQLPGYVLIIFWFVMDVWGVVTGGDLPVAYWAHLGGFVYGVTIGAFLVYSGRVKLESYDNSEAGFSAINVDCPYIWKRNNETCHLPCINLSSQA
jgi:membrane associated rhomboid family serine protease